MNLINLIVIYLYRKKWGTASFFFRKMDQRYQPPEKEGVTKCYTFNAYQYVS